MRQWIAGMLLTALAAAAGSAPAQTSSGTAFAVAPDLLVTVRHVVSGCSAIEIVTGGGRRRGTLAAAGVDSDLAVVRAAGLGGAAGVLRSPRTVRLGEAAMLFGFPLAGALSSEGNFTAGLVSALRGLRDAAGEFQITAPVQPGNSGGPVLDAAGRVIGVVQAKLDALRAAGATGDIPQNVNFAVSLQVLADFLARNGIPFAEGAPSAPLDTAQVAALAREFTYRIDCLGEPGQGATPSEPRRVELITADGSRYSGEMRDGRIHGRGTALYPNGDRYAGEFRDNKRHGEGTYVFADGGTYAGEYRNDDRNGRGAATYPNGDRYVGEFKDNKRHGQGRYTFASGGIYVGEYRDDRRHGEGTEYRADGSLVRSGIWEDDAFVRSR